MKALILNSGLGSRMGSYTKNHPKCMTELTKEDTILSRQLRILKEMNINDIIITTGYYNKVLMEYCDSLGLDLDIRFVENPLYAETNYIYSIYLAREFLTTDVVLLHGDLVFEKEVMKRLLFYNKSCVKISTTADLPEKDFKAVVKKGRIEKIGVEFFEDAFEAQALYKLKLADLNIWLDKIVEFCESGRRNCYAEEALNEVFDKCMIMGLDVQDLLCMEVDTPKDLEKVREKL